MCASLQKEEIPEPASLLRDGAGERAPYQDVMQVSTMGSLRSSKAWCMPLIDRGSTHHRKPGGGGVKEVRQ